MTLTKVSFWITFKTFGLYCLRDTVLKNPLDYLVNHELRCMFVTYLWPAVAFAGEDVTRDKKERVLMSVVKAGAAKKSSNIPAGGVGPS